MGARRTSGFTIVELMIVLVIMVILALLAVPAMGTWVANSKVRTVAESLQNDLRAAQLESVRRSHQVAFVLTSAQPSATAAPSTSGKNWYTDIIPMTDDSSESLTLAQSNTIASQYGVTVAAKISSTAIAILCFNSEGRLTTNSATGLGVSCTAPSGISPLTFDLSLSGADRPLRVEVQQGGRVRLCDPAKTLQSTTPDGCTS